jgi:hypothetical protein
VTTISLSARRAPDGRAGLLAVAAAAAGALALAAAALVLGPVPAAAAFVGLVAAVFLLGHAGWAVGVTIGVLVFAEASRGWGVPVFADLYTPTAITLSPVNLLTLLAVASVVLDAIRPGVGFRSLAPFGAALGLAASAIVFGVLYGVLGGRAIPYTVTSTLQTTAPLFVMPFLIVNVVRSREDLLRVLRAIPAIALLKALAGFVVVFGGLGEVSEGLGRLTYYEPATNYLFIVFLLGMLAAALARVPTGRLARWAVPAVVLCLVLSYRRSFWVATVACALILLLLGSGRELRRLLPVVVVLVGVAGYAAFTGGLLGSSDSEVVQRAQSLSPQKVTSNDQDRYRLAERENILRALEREPLTGIGIGVDWPTRYPLPFEGANLHQYSHLAFLWWWMKAGLLGGLAYLAILGTTLVAGLRVWRRHADPLISTAGLAAAVSVIGFVVVELAATILGSDERGTAVLGCVIGLLAVAYRDLPGRAGARAA